MQSTQVALLFLLAAPLIQAQIWQWGTPSIARYQQPAQLQSLVAVPAGPVAVNAVNKHVFNPYEYLINRRFVVNQPKHHQQVLDIDEPWTDVYSVDEELVVPQQLHASYQNIPHLVTEQYSTPAAAAAATVVYSHPSEYSHASDALYHARIAKRAEQINQAAQRAATIANMEYMDALYPSNAGYFRNALVANVEANQQNTSGDSQEVYPYSGY